MGVVVVVEAAEGMMGNVEDEAKEGEIRRGWLAGEQRTVGEESSLEAAPCKVDLGESNGDTTGEDAGNGD